MACVSGLTNGVYSFVDCCGNLQAGVSLGQSICIDGAYSGSATGVYVATGITCTQNCNTGILSYSFTTTGICDSSSGTTVITPFGGVLPYTIDNVEPGTLPLQIGNGPFTYTGLTGGTYVFRLNDNTGFQNNEVFINIFVSGCFVATFSNVQDTTCGLDNGSLTITATSNNSPYNIILYKDGNIDNVIQTQTLPYTFNNIGAGSYYATVIDYGTTSANTPNTIVNTSTSVNFGLWKVNASTCVINTGKLAVTGVTGTGPFTYSWNNGQTTQLITGLTPGNYSCTVTDSLGCSKTVYETIGTASPLGLIGTTSTSPSCFGSDGILTYTISGGSSPYYFSANTGQVGYTLSDTFSLTNLSSGNYSLYVRDANFCVLNLTGYLSTQNGFTVTSLNVVNSNCDQNNGQISVTIDGTGGQNYLYILSGQTNLAVYNYFGTNQSFTKTGLSNDTYDLLISGAGTECVYTTTATINSQQKFTVSATTTGSTCNEPNGILNVVVGTGYTGSINYVLENLDSQFIPDDVRPNSNISAQTYNNLIAGNYIITVTDQTGCAVSQSFSITTTNSLNFSVEKFDCLNGDPGYASAVIYQGEPPFTYNWSNGQTGSTATGLTASTYTLTITDDNGCTDINYFNISCIGDSVTSYQLYEICSNNFITSTGNRRGLSEMLNEGYYDIITTQTGCTLVSAEFVTVINLNGTTYTQPFYTATTLNDFPQDSLWVSTIESILSTIPEIGDYNLDFLNNTTYLESICDGDNDPLADAPFSLGLRINYDINCVVPAPPTPTPTPTLPPINCGISGYTFEINQI